MTIKRALAEARPAAGRKREVFNREWLEEAGRGLHSFTSQLNLSAIHGIGGARRGYVARVKGVFMVCWVFLCVRHGSS
jgi:hypothetical protein